MNQPVTQVETTKVSADPPRKPKQKAPTVIVFFLVAAAALFIGIATFGIYTRNQWTAAVQQRTNEAARMLVEVVHPEKSTGMIHLQLAGQTTPDTDASIFAQTSGYLKKWYFDVGTKFKAGEVLAEIDTPEVDQILAQAKAILAQAKAQLKMAQAARKGKVISAQDFDTAADIYGGNQAVVAAEQPNVDSLEALEAFKIIRAPFDGTVTARNTDIGAYVPAGSGTPLFRMAATSRLRVYVTVPRALSSLIRVGEQAELTVDLFPGRKFPAQVVRTAGAISSDAKGLLTELEVPNPTGELSSGSYVQITLDIPIDDRGALSYQQKHLWPGYSDNRPRQRRPYDPSGKVALHIRKSLGWRGPSEWDSRDLTIAISRDLGSKLEISRGLSESNQIVGSPPPSLVDGDVVNFLK